MLNKLPLKDDFTSPELCETRRVLDGFLWTRGSHKSHALASIHFFPIVVSWKCTPPVVCAAVPHRFMLSHLGFGP